MAVTREGQQRYRFQAVANAATDTSSVLGKSHQDRPRFFFLEWEKRVAERRVDVERIVLVRSDASRLRLCAPSNEILCGRGMLYMMAGSDGRDVRGRRPLGSMVLGARHSSGAIATIGRRVTGVARAQQDARSPRFVLPDRRRG